MPDTSVRHYSTYSSGQMVQGVAGSLINALDECLIIGGPSYNISSISVANNIATANFTLPHYVDPFYYSGTILLLHGDGNNNGTVFTDSSQSNAAMSYSGSAVTSTAAKKFGTASIYFSGSSDRISTSSGSYWTLGSSDFCIEFWVNATSPQPQTYPSMLSANDSASFIVGTIWRLAAGHNTYTNCVTLWVGNYSTTAPLLQSTTNIVGAGWTHIAVTRQGGSNFRLFVNGIQEGATGYFTGDMGVASGSATQQYLGGVPSSGTFGFKGYIEDFRLTKGYYRYLSNFTPPQCPYPNSLGTIIENNQIVSIRGLPDTVFNGEFRIKDVTASSLITTQNLTATFPVTTGLSSATIPTTSLLCHFNPINGDTTLFYDETGKVITTNGSAVLSSTQSKFGGYSGYFSAAANTYLTTSASNDFGLGSGDFTIEFWLNADASQGNVPTVIINTDGTWAANTWQFVIDNNYQNTGKPSFFCNNYNTGPGLLVGNTNLKGIGWTHVAIVRSGNTFYLFINGTQDATNTFSGSLDNGGSNSLSIMGASSSSNYLLKGYIDELRITKGTAIYTSTFTPPNRPLGMSLTPLGWNKVFSGTNKAVYQSADSSSTKLYLRVDDTTTTYATVNLYETMTTIDVGTPTTQTTLYWVKSDTADTVRKNWFLIGNSKVFYLMVDWRAAYLLQPSVYSFGDMTSVKPGDAYNCVLIGSSATNPTYPYQANDFQSMLSQTNRTGQILARSYSQVSNSMPFYKYSASMNAYIGGGNQPTTPSSNLPDNGIHINPLYVYEYPSNAYRGTLLGVFAPIESLTGGIPSRDTSLIINNKTYICYRICSGNSQSNYGNVFFDLTGPWS